MKDHTVVRVDPTYDVDNRYVSYCAVYGRRRKGSLCTVIEERRRHIIRVAGGSTLGKESQRMGTLPSMTILVMENY